MNSDNGEDIIPEQLEISFSSKITPRRKFSYSSLIKKKIANELSNEGMFRATMVE